MVLLSYIIYFGVHGITFNMISKSFIDHYGIPLQLIKNDHCIIYQKRAVILANNALKSFVGVPTPSGFDAKSKALNCTSSKFSACQTIRLKTRYPNLIIT